MSSSIVPPFGCNSGPSGPYCPVLPPTQLADSLDQSLRQDLEGTYFEPGRFRFNCCPFHRLSFLLYRSSRVCPVRVCYGPDPVPRMPPEGPDRVAQHHSDYAGGITSSAFRAAVEASSWVFTWSRASARPLTLLAASVMAGPLPPAPP